MSSIEKKVCDKIIKRSKIGKKKYGTTMERNDLTKLQWLKHAQEEAMDLAVYLEKIIQELENIPFTYEWNITEDNGEHNRKMLDLEIENLGKEKED
tara:strand:+ start:2655 stop:2942 length:288 start_codon:yes stop_codon:yes gene_type:complete